MNKKVARIRRAQKTRLKIAELGATRLVVYKSNNHIYAQVIDKDGTKVIVSASTAGKTPQVEVKSGGTVEAAKAVGKLIAEKAVAAGVKDVAFDRSGFKYHGRIKALAESAREHGLVF